MKNEATIAGIVVGGQPTKAELEDGRFATIINLRHDHEDGNVTRDLVPAGTAYVSVPWTAEAVTAADIALVKRSVAESSGPVLIH